MDIANIKVQPCKVVYDGADLGFTDGDIEVTTEEAGVEITAHQEGTNVLDMIRTGKKVEIALTLKETTTEKVAAILAKGGGVAGSAAAVTEITAQADVGGSLNNRYFFFHGPAADQDYLLWFNVNGEGDAPEGPEGYTPIQVAVATNATATAVADALAAALDALAAFTAPNPAAAVVTVTNVAAGIASPPTDGNTGWDFEVTVAGANVATGWGKSKDFTGMLQDSAKLVLHPIANADANEADDVAIWKAYPILGSITYSGENPKTVSVTFKVFPDSSKADEVRLFQLGAHSQ